MHRGGAFRRAASKRSSCRTFGVAIQCLRRVAQTSRPPSRLVANFIEYMHLVRRWAQEFVRWTPQQRGAVHLGRQDPQATTCSPRCSSNASKSLSLCSRRKPSVKHRVAMITSMVPRTLTPRARSFRKFRADSTASSSPPNATWLSWASMRRASLKPRSSLNPRKTSARIKSPTTRLSIPRFFSND